MISPSRRGPAAAGIALLAALVLASSARAAGPLIEASFSTDVGATNARLHARITSPGAPGTYHFDYITQAAYEANLAGGKDGFAGALKAPAGSDAGVGEGGPFDLTQVLGGLKADTAYRYRVLAKSALGTETGATLSFATFPLAAPALLDGRAWEMVSPADKNGGQVDPPESIAAGGLEVAAAQGGAVTYSSAASFGQGAQGAPPGSQYLATRSAGGWATENLTVPIFSGTYADGGGVPYRLFSEDLARAVLLNGDHCRGEGSGCAVANPPLPASGAPAGYQNYYLRDNATGSYSALLGPSELAAQDPARFDLALVGASPDLAHLVLSSCAALSPAATEVPLGEGCDPTEQNLYEWSPGSPLRLLNLLPAQATGTPGAKLAAPAGAISADGSRVYFTLGGKLYLREGDSSTQVDATAGAGGSFQAASTDGSLAYFLAAEHLWRYSAAGAADLTPAGALEGVLGASADGTYLYFQDAGGLKLWHAGTTSTIAAGAGASEEASYPPASATARVSPDGTHLLFASKASLTGYDNTDQASGLPDSELYLYDASAPSLTCVSCNPTGERPIGSASIPGARANGKGPQALAPKPRALAAGARRVFFDSADALVPLDTNHRQDVYEWEAPGEGSCTRQAGCLSLISSGKAEEGASFLDASADGQDAFFLTDASLVASDPGSLDLYDARIGGGFGEPSPPIPCEGDACQILPSEPLDPTLTTLLSGLGNPKVRYVEHNKVPKAQHRKKHHHKKHHHHHHHGKQKRGQRGGR